MHCKERRELPLHYCLLHICVCVCVQGPGPGQYGGSSVSVSWSSSAARGGRRSRTDGGQISALPQVRTHSCAVTVVDEWMMSKCWKEKSLEVTRLLWITGMEQGQVVLEVWLSYFNCIGDRSLLCVCVRTDWQPHSISVSEFNKDWKVQQWKRTYLDRRRTLCVRTLNTRRHCSV